MSRLDALNTCNGHPYARARHACKGTQVKWEYRALVIVIYFIYELESQCQMSSYVQKTVIVKKCITKTVISLNSCGWMPTPSILPITLGSAWVTPGSATKSSGPHLSLHSVCSLNPENVLYRTINSYTLNFQNNFSW